MGEHLRTGGDPELESVAVPIDYRAIARREEPCPVHAADGYTGAVTPRRSTAAI